ncbi:hypothetical protein OHR68_09975 [Spirillospora sp. NBC_00431]
MALRLGELVAVISADDSGFRRTLGRVHSGLRAVGKVGALAALAGSATHLAVALAPAAGILAVLPGALIAAKVAGFALSLALTGVSDALGSAISGDMEKFNEQLKEMPPAARSVVGELGVAFAGLQATAQNAFFAPMRKQARGLGDDLRGPLQQGTATITAAFGRMGAKVLAFAREARTLNFIRGLSKAIARGLDGASSGVTPLLRGFRDLAAVSFRFFGPAGQGLGRLMARAGEWMSRMARGGQATRWITNAVATLQRLGRIGRNVALTIGNIFKNAGAGQSGGLLATIEQITAGLLAWSQSAEGQQQIAATFRLLNDTASELAGILPLLVGPLGLIASIIQSLPGPTQGAASQMLAWAIVISVVTSRLAPLGRAVRSVAGHLSNSDSVTRRVARRMGSAFAAAGRGIGRAAAAAGRAAASFTVAAGRMALAAGRAALAGAAAGARMAASAALSAARVVGMWALMGTQALIQGAKAAMFWVLANWPIVLLVAAVAAAVYLIIKHWDKIVKFFTQTLPHWIKVGLDFVIDLIKKGAKYGFFGPVGLIIAHWDKVKAFFTKTLPSALKKGFDFVVNLIKNAAKFGFLGPIGLIISHWDKISKFFTQTLPRAVSSGINNVVGSLRRLPGWVVSAVGNTGKLLVNAGKSVLIGFWNGMVAMAGWLGRQIGRLIRNVVPGPVLRVLGIASPSKLFAGYGKNVAEGMALGMHSNKGLVSDAAGALAGAAAGGAVGVSRPGVRRPTAGVVAGGGGPARVELSFANADNEFVRFFRKVVRVKGRGDVQVLVAGRA